MTRILADDHHMGLTQSLKYLFADRLGYELRFPAGMEWWNENLWAVFPHESTAQQYLERETQGKLGITLEEFKDTKFDILLCSIPQHVPIWLKLRDLYQPQAKLIMQIGNAWAFDNNFPIKNIMASAKIPPLSGFNVIEYHQESDLVYQYKEKIQLPDKNIYSFINCFGVMEHYQKDYAFFLELEKQMNDWSFKSIGGQNRDNWCNGDQEVASKMREAMFGIHLKTGGDGMGHVIHNLFQVGTPPIINKSYYRGTLAEPLIEDGVTCIVVDDKSINQIIQEIKYFSQPENYFKLSKNTGQRFLNVVNYNQEELEIRMFLDKLI